jgi:hypothetical protein
MKLKITTVLLLALAPLAASFTNARLAQACYTGCGGTAPNRFCQVGGDGANTCWSDGAGCHFGGTCVG